MEIALNSIFVDPDGQSINFILNKKRGVITHASAWSKSITCYQLIILAITNLAFLQELSPEPKFALIALRLKLLGLTEP